MLVGIFEVRMRSICMIFDVQDNYELVRNIRKAISDEFCKAYFYFMNSRRSIMVGVDQMSVLTYWPGLIPGKFLFRPFVKYDAQM